MNAPPMSGGIVYLALYGYAMALWHLCRGVSWLTRRLEPTAPRWMSGTITGCPVVGIMRSERGRFVLMCWRRTLYIARPTSRAEGVDAGDDVDPATHRVAESRSSPATAVAGSTCRAALATEGTSP